MPGPTNRASDHPARIGVMTAMVTAQDETFQLCRLVEFAAAWPSSPTSDPTSTSASWSMTCTTT